ncbi:hypothetical protein Mapa_006162 [Marchantia paleacea]|nr:hypothetical protein Mapa_006162 [Marchantia paleacea]
MKNARSYRGCQIHRCHRSALRGQPIPRLAVSPSTSLSSPHRIGPAVDRPPKIHNPPLPAVKPLPDSSAASPLPRFQFPSLVSIQFLIQGPTRRSSPLQSISLPQNANPTHSLGPSGSQHFVPRFLLFVRPNSFFPHSSSWIPAVATATTPTTGSIEINPRLLPLLLSLLSRRLATNFVGRTTRSGLLRSFCPLKI